MRRLTAAFLLLLLAGIAPLSADVVARICSHVARTRPISAAVGVTPVVARTPYTPPASSHTFSATASNGNYHCYSGATSRSTALGCSFGIAPASGTLVTALIFYQPSTMNPTVEDDSSPTPHTYTCSTGSTTYDASAGSILVCYWYATATGGSNIILSFTGTCNFCSIRGDVWNASGTGDVVIDTAVNTTGYIVGDGTTGTSINTPTVTSPSTGDLLICGSASENGITATGSPWTAPPVGGSPSIPTASFGEGYGYILSASGSQACAFTQSSGHWDSIAAAFK